MSALVKAESVTLLSAVETTLGTQPTTLWRQHQPNPDGISDFYPKIKKVARDPLSKNRQKEKGDVVDLTAEPKITHDLNKELLDFFGPGIMLSLEKFSGGTGVGRFSPSAASGGVVLSAVAAGAFTVASGGAVQQGTLVYTRGFTNAANNGLLLVAAASTAISIKVTAAVLEASPPNTAMLEVVGFQGASGDITIDASGNLVSTAADFTTMGLLVGQWIWIGGGTAAAPGALGFATAADRGWAKITAIIATKLTLSRRTQAYSADTGTGKTIQLFWGSWLRNVAIDHADYLETSYQLELALPGAASAAATDYVYAQGNYIDTFEVNGPLTDKAVASILFNGTNIADPGTARATGASTALVPLASAAMNTVTELQRIRIVDQAGEANISVDVSSWKLNFQNNVTPQKQQGTLGAVRMIVGKAIAEVDLEVFLIQDDTIKAIRDNRSLMWEAAIRNNDCGVVFDIPSATLEDGAEKFPANGPVTMTPKLMAFRDPTFGYTLGISRFPFLPAS